MSDKNALCDKIHNIYPDLGDCDDNLEVTWDKDANAWAVNFEKDGYQIKHYLENEDAADCLERDQCIGLGIEFGQFR